MWRSVGKERGIPGSRVTAIDLLVSTSLRGVSEFAVASLQRDAIFTCYDVERKVLSLIYSTYRSGGRIALKYMLMVERQPIINSLIT